ncbi:serpin family protein [Candidatus Micrarchaeota archaeon]|nr:serpin family protein [Candidatus Micrarchaeota archaeon]
MGDPTAASIIANSNNQFAFDMYNEVNNGDENVFFSPWSAGSALAMTYEGSNGITRNEIASVLHLTTDINQTRSGYQYLNSILNHNSNVQISNANAIWVQQDYVLRNEYVNALNEYYSAEATNLDFANNPDNSRSTINDWVEQRTSGKITNLLPPNSITPLTRLVITNAIYFKGNWATQFKLENTHDTQFKLNNGGNTTVNMMAGTEKWNYTEDEDVQVLELPYEGNTVSMIILLPKNNIRALEQELNAGRFENWMNSLNEEEISAQIPKFKLETGYSLNEPLMDLGMESAFTSNADFSDMDGTKSLSISQVIHKAYCAVDEEGTEAAAATAIVMEKAASVENKVFIADHPFVFAIVEKETGSILFLGKVMEPNY